MGSIKTLSKTAIVLLLFCFSRRVLADEPLPTLPKYYPCKYDNKDAACYDLEGVKALLELEALAQKLQKQSYLDGSIIARYQEVIQDKNAQLDAASKNNEVLLNAYLKQTEELKKQIELKNQYKYRPIISMDSGLSWLIAGSVVFIAGGFVLGYELK